MTTESQINVSVISSFSSVSDKDIIKMYRSTLDQKYASVMIFRYEYLLLKIIKQWHYSKKLKVPYEEYDFEDILQTAYLGMLECFVTVSDVDAIKNVGSRIKSYVYVALDRVHKHKGREEMVENFPEDTDGDVRCMDAIDVKRLEGKCRELYYYVLHYCYTSYKIGMVMFKTRSRRNMRMMGTRQKDWFYDEIRKYIK